MSGTLTIDTDFSFIEHKWGLKPNEAINKYFKSPFDYTNQAIIYIPKGLHHPISKHLLKRHLSLLKICLI